MEYEKALMLLHEVDENVNFLGLDKFEELLNDSEKLEFIERRGFSLKEYYKEYRVQNFGLAWEIQERDRKIFELSNRERENEEEIHLLNKELKNMQIEIKNMRESIS